MVDLDNAEPITNFRIEELREALLSARDLNLDLSSDYLVKN
jgi:hypothetical protein